MADIAEIQELARSLCLMNTANGVIDLNDETISNKEYLYNVLKQELDLRAKKKISLPERAPWHQVPQRTGKGHGEPQTLSGIYQG